MMRKVAFAGLVVLGLALAAQAASYGTVYATLGGDFSKTEAVSTTVEAGSFYCGAYAMSFDHLVLDNPNATAEFLWGSGTQNVFCVDPFQNVYVGDHNLYAIHDLQDAPTPLYGSFGGMGAVKAGQIATLLNNAGLDSGTPSGMSAHDDTSLALAIWEIVAENQSVDGSGYSVNSGVFQLTSGNALLAADANNRLAALKTAFDLGTDFSLVNTKPYYALIRPDANGQDFVTAIAVQRRPVPEPLTMASAFMAISSLGLYIRRRAR